MLHPTMSMTALGLLLAACAARARAHGAGEALFSGKHPLKGTIRGHRDSLPPDVVACASCHEMGPAVEASRAPAPRIESSLFEPQARRGGPPSSYDESSFCKLLRTGIDPAYVLIARVMPTYEINGAECAALWQYLTEGQP